MNERVDFATLRDKFPAESVIAYLGFTLEAKPVNKKLADGTDFKDTSYRGKCPFCKDAHAFAISKTRRRYHCFKCKVAPDEKFVGGDFIKLVSKVKDIDPREAAIELTKACGLQDTAAPKEKASGFDPEKYLASLDTEHETVLSMGLTSQTLKEWKAGYKKGKLMVAVEDSEGIAGFIGIDPETMAMSFPKEARGKPFDPRVYIFGGYKLELDTVQILRTPFDVLMASENGIGNCVAFLNDPVNVSQLFYLSKFLEDRKLETIALS